MEQRIPVAVYARDPISQVGISTQLRSRPEVTVVQNGEANVSLVVVDEVDEECIQTVKTLYRNGCPRVVLVVTRIDDAAVLAAVEAGASGLLRRSEAHPERLAQAAQAAAAGEGDMPRDLLGRLLDNVGRLQRQVLAPRGLTFSGITDREASILRLVAEGHDTGEIAQQLCYSERTIKNVLHDLTARFNLRNRTHAVAFALKEGLI